MTFGIVGMGLMGGSYAKRLKELGCRVVGCNRSPEPLAAALADGAIDAAGPEHLKEAQIVIFCMAESLTEAFVKDHLQDFARDAVLTDAAGVKRGGAARIQALLPAGMDFISAHPMAGREGSGYGQSSPAIFDGANYILVPSAANRPEHVALIREMALALGSRYVPVVTPAEHDRIIAYTSDLPHAVASALVASDSFEEKMRHFVAGGFRDTTRIADINSTLWTDLFLLNRDNLLEEIDRFQAAMTQLREAIAARDRKAIASYLDEVRRRRRSLDGKDQSGAGQG